MITTDEETPGPPVTVGMQQIAPGPGKGGDNEKKISVNWGRVSYLPQCTKMFRVSARSSLHENIAEHSYVDWVDVAEEGDNIAFINLWTLSDYNLNGYTEFEVSVQAITRKSRLGEPKIIRGYLTELDESIPEPNNKPVFETTHHTSASKPHLRK